MVAGQHRNIKCLAFISLGIALIYIVICPVFSLSGLIENIWIPGSDMRAQRYALGFNHPNTLGYELLTVSVSVSIIRFGRKPSIDIAVIVVCILATLIIAGSRTVVLCMVIQGFMLLLFYRYGACSRALSIGCFVTVAIVIVFSIYFMVCFNESNGLELAINDLLSNRLLLAHRYYLAHGPELFGYSYDGIVIWNYLEFTVDNAYSHLVLRTGLVLTVVLLLLISLFYKRCILKCYSGVVLFGLTLFLIYGVTEVAAFRIEANYFLVALVTVFNKQKVPVSFGECRQMEVE